MDPSILQDCLCRKTKWFLTFSAFLLFRHALVCSASFHPMKPHVALHKYDAKPNAGTPDPFRVTCPTLCNDANLYLLCRDYLCAKQNEHSCGEHSVSKISFHGAFPQDSSFGSLPMYLGLCIFVSRLQKLIGALICIISKVGGLRIARCKHGWLRL